MRQLWILFLLLILTGVNYVVAQSAYIPTGSESYYLTDRYEIKSGRMNDYFHSALRPYRRSEVATFIDSFSVSGISFTKRDYFNLDYLQTDNFEWSNSDNAKSKRPVLKAFYRNKTALFSVRKKDFNFVVNPVIHFSYGKNFADGRTLYTNTRGAEIRGSIDNRIGFYTYLADNQTSVPTYLERSIDSSQVFPGVGYLKPFKVGGYDFFQARGYVTAKVTRHIELQFGHDRNFIGNGFRSLILSDFSREYLFLKINTHIWKLNYQNLFSEHSDFRTFTSPLRKKFAATHHLSINIGKNLNIGLFETVIFFRDTNQVKGFELNYLNPIIFYRAVEQNLNSTDNAMVGLDWKYNFLRHFQFYGQFLLDEFLLAELKAQNGWWANKFAMQAGMKYVDVFGIPNLDIQGEINAARPFTYTHYRREQNYIHYNQPLAHPLGANFYEIIGQMRYQILKRFTSTTRVFHMVHGLDNNIGKFGGNILQDYRNRFQDYGNKIGQGTKQEIVFIDQTFTYMFRHNVFFDLKLIRRTQPGLNDNCVYLGFRMNIIDRRYEF